MNSSRLDIEFSVEEIENEVELEREIRRVVANREFISHDESYGMIEKLETLAPELCEFGKSVYFRAVRELVTAECLTCSEAGLFRWHFLGRLTHPNCMISSYVGPGFYLKHQLGATLESGVNAAASAVQPDMRGESPGIMGKFFLALWGFSFGFLFRFAGALLVLPVQAIAWLTQGKKFERIYTVSLNNPQSRTLR